MAGHAQGMSPSARKTFGMITIQLTPEFTHSCVKRWSPSCQEQDGTTAISANRTPINLTTGQGSQPGRAFGPQLGQGYGVLFDGLQGGRGGLAWCNAQRLRIQARSEMRPIKMGVLGNSLVQRTVRPGH